MTTEGFTVSHLRGALRARPTLVDSTVRPVNTRTARKPIFILRTEPTREALHDHRGYPFLADRPAAIGPLHFELGGHCKWNYHSSLGEWDRVRDRRRTCGDAMA